MPTATCTIPEANVFFARCFGYITPDDVIGWEVESKLSDGGEKSASERLVTLVDLSEITGTDMTFNDMNAIYGKLVRHYEPRNQKLCLVLYAPDDLAFGMTRILQSLCGMTDHIEVQIFKDPNQLSELLPEVPDTLPQLKAKTAVGASSCSA